MLPQLQDTIFLMDGGIETTLVFQEGVELRDFAAFELFESETGHERLKAYYRRHADIARSRGAGFIFEAPTWRASRDWGARLGYDREALDRINRTAIGMMQRLRDQYQRASTMQAVVSGCIGPRGDGYAPEQKMSVDEAQDYHRDQLSTFSNAGAEMATALTLCYSEEAIGIARGAQAVGLPVVLAFTVETDGRLPSGETLSSAVQCVDRETGYAPAYYMINCAHPDHFRDTLSGDAAWKERIRGLRANASRLSHAELDEAEELDDGNPDELGGDYRALRRILPSLNVLGGCCGTDHRHIDAIARSCLRPSEPA